MTHVRLQLVVSDSFLFHCPLFPFPWAGISFFWSISIAVYFLWCASRVFFFFGCRCKRFVRHLISLSPEKRCGTSRMVHSPTKITGTASLFTAHECRTTPASTQIPPPTPFLFSSVHWRSCNRMLSFQTSLLFLLLPLH